MVAPLRGQLQGVSLYRSLTLEENIIVVITQDRVTDGNLKRSIKNKTFGGTGT